MKFRIAYWFATCGFLGQVPYGPGTVGSFIAIPLVLVLQNRPFSLLLSCALLVVLAVWTSDVVAAKFNQKDPQEIVIDEFCGLLISFLFLPIRWQTLLAGFFLFRFFDITKPAAIRQIEQIPNGFGIVFDDLMAGVYTNFILHILIRYAHL